PILRTAITLPLSLHDALPISTDAMNGQRLAAGIGSLRSGAAATTVVSKVSFSSTRRPVTTGSSPSLSHSGVLLSTTGMCAKLYTGGGEVVAHSRLAAPHGFGGAIAPRYSETTPLITKSSTAAATTNAPMVDSRFGS